MNRGRNASFPAPPAQIRTCSFRGIDSKKVMNSLELFASKVMPQFAD
jgi:hypothetical protein